MNNNHRTTTMPPAPDYEPSGQIMHEKIASISKSQNPNYIWTVASWSTPGIMVETDPITLPQGKYIAMVQIWHKNQTDKLGEIRLYVDRKETKKVDIIGTRIGSSTTPEGEYQRIPLEFTLTDAFTEGVQIAIYYNNNHYIWTGATHLTRIGDHDGPTEKRPIFVIAHRRNNIERMKSAFDDEGANAAEFDISPVDKGINQFRAYHPPQGVPSDDLLKWGTQHEDMPAFFSQVKDYLDNGTAAGIMWDMKQEYSGKEPYEGDVKQLAIDFLDTLESYGFSDKHLKRCIFSVPQGSSASFNEGLKSKNFAGALDAYLEGDYPATGEGQGRVKYVDNSEEYGASFLGIGIDHLVITSLMHKWMSWIMEMVNQRDRDGKLKKVYFWTLESKISMRKVLDYGMDGIITNRPERLVEIVNSYPYNQMVKMATQDDSLDEVHGFEKFFQKK